MYTWLSGSEFESYSKVSNKELNDLFQEVRGFMPDVFISERVQVEKRIFCKKELKIVYSIYNLTKKPEVRCLNLNLSSTPLVFNYLCGLLNGYHANKNELKQTK